MASAPRPSDQLTLLPWMGICLWQLYGQHYLAGAIALFFGVGLVIVRNRRYRAPGTRWEGPPPPEPPESVRKARRRDAVAASTGCLGLLLFLVGLPIAAVLGWARLGGPLGMVKVAAPLGALIALVLAFLWSYCRNIDHRQASLAPEQAEAERLEAETYQAALDRYRRRPRWPNNVGATPSVVRSVQVSPPDPLARLAAGYVCDLKVYEARLAAIRARLGSEAPAYLIQGTHAGLIGHVAVTETRVITAFGDQAASTDIAAIDALFRDGNGDVHMATKGSDFVFRIWYGEWTRFQHCVQPSARATTGNKHEPSV